MIVAAFPLSTCRPCPVRALCTSGQRSGRHLTLHPRAIQETLDAARVEQTTPAWRDRYAIRCGIEATIHQAVTVTGMRRARYRGIKKVHLEHIVSAVAVNLIRLDAWWNGQPWPYENELTSRVVQAPADHSPQRHPGPDLQRRRGVLAAKDERPATLRIALDLQKRSPETWTHAPDASSRPFPQVNPQIHGWRVPTDCETRVSARLTRSAVSRAGCVRSPAPTGP
ncbi:transposase [Nonomuraea sediminis]|uniref:transposase n=1 Tax=Nonomuraea sediminis TaxID=2835864 RepID=UPI001BDD97EE